MDEPASGDDATGPTSGAAVANETLDALAGQLVWRIGRTSEAGPVTVRIGLASSTPHFAELPKLRSASDAELEEALANDTVRVEWVGPRSR